MGRRLGRAYAVNTVGAVIGTVAAGTIVIPAVGLQATILLASLLNLLAGTGLNLVRDQAALAKRLPQSGLAISVVSGLTFSLHPWNPQILSSGVYAYADRYLEVIERAMAIATDRFRTCRPDPWELWERPCDSSTGSSIGPGRPRP